jgi:hypothetical protein
MVVRYHGKFGAFHIGSKLLYAKDYCEALAFSHGVVAFGSIQCATREADYLFLTLYFLREDAPDTDVGCVTLNDKRFGEIR